MKKRIRKITQLTIFIFAFLNAQLSTANSFYNRDIFENFLSFEFYKSVNFNNFDHNLNETCLEHLNAIGNALKKREKWALELIDSWGKIPSGILWFNIMDLGNFDQCLQVISDNKIEGDYVKGKYCTALLPLKKLIPAPTFFDETNNLINLNQLQVPPEIFNIHNNIKERKSTLKNSTEAISNINLKIGACLPKMCRPEYVNELVKKFLKDKLGIELNKNETVFNSESCAKHPDDIHYENIDYFAITFFSVIAGLMFFSSIYDLIMQELNKKGKILWTSFSIFTNGKKLFAPAPPNSDNVIGCLNGIRCLSMLWVLVGHSYAFGPALPFINMIDIVQWKSSIFAQLIFNANICVDSFFFLSGFLVAWMGFKELQKSKGKLNVPLMYFHRYIRLTPVIAVAILFLQSLFKFLGDGPYWGFVATFSNNECNKYWWTTLLYVFNYVNPHEPCLLHSWYLNVDTQLYFLSPLLLIPTYKWGRKFLYPVGIVICALSIGCCFATHYIYKFPMIRTENNGKPDLYTSKIYYATHTRASPWVVGFVFGYFMFTNKSKRFKISKIFNLTGWLISVSIILTIIFGPYARYQPGAVATPLEATFYESFKRISWAIALSWIVFSCHKGYGGIINSFLSYPFWAIFGRLTYCMYIYHILVLIANVGRLRTHMYFKDYDYQLIVWGHLGLTVFTSIVTTLAFELPILQLEKVIFGTKGQNNNDKKLDKLENSNCDNIRKENVE